MDRLLKYLPPHERESVVFQEVMQSEEKQFDKLDSDIEDLKKQFDLDTATWGLAIYEKELGLPIRPNVDIEIRRGLVKAKTLMQPPSSKAKLIEILKSFIETAEIEECFSEYNFDIVLKTSDVVGDKLPYIHRIVEEFKPAHLAYMFIICYLYYPKILNRFQKYFSEKFEVSGIKDIGGNKYISTLGKSYKDKTLYTFNNWYSSKIPAVSETETIQGRGNNYKEKFEYKFDSWISADTLTTCKENTIDNFGSMYRSELSYKLQPYISGLIPVCSKNTYIGEVVA